MKTDENYIYPESAEELAMFYGWESERLEVPSSIDPNQVGLEAYYSKKIFVLCLSDLVDGIEGWLSDYDSPYRIPLPTINELKVGDVVKRTHNIGHFARIEEVRSLESVKAISNNMLVSSISLLIGRNTWVPVKCD